MKRFAVSACVLALFAAAGSPALAQVAPPALPISLPAIPEPQDVARPGVIGIAVDATDLNRRIFRVRQTIPVTPGPLVLFFPEWLPGNHGPVGPISSIGGLIFTADGQRVEWVRDTLNTYAYHLNIPAGATELVAEFQHLSPVNGDQRVTITDEMLNIQWEKMLFYPAGHYSRNITFQPSVTLPEGWHYGVALEPQSASATGSTTTFAPVSLEVLVDSPMFAGKHYRQIDLDPGGRSPVRLNIVADNAASMAATDPQIELHRNLVDQADRLFGARHFDHYDFLLAMTERLGGIGLEHHRSSENSVDPGYFTDWDSKIGDRTLLAHEYTHSWNGKWRRPADQITANFNEPLQNSLLWVYEGQTQYWGEVLTARSGLFSKEQALQSLALTAAVFDTRVGREWRAMQDTTNDPIISQRQAKGWLSWQRDEDYYQEGQLIWLDVDTLIREKTNGRRSLDDFARAFYGVEDGDWSATPYTFDLVVQTLNGVVEHDWASFLRTRLDGHGPGGPLDGITRGGYRLVYRETPSDYMKTLYSEYGRRDFTWSLGFQTTSANVVRSVQWGGPAFDLGLRVGVELLAVNGDPVSEKAIQDAVTAAKGTSEPIEFIVKEGERYRVVRFDYHDGLRYPHLERVEGTPDRLGDIYAARRR